MPGLRISPIAIPPYAPAMFFSRLVGSKNSIVATFGFFFLGFLIFFYFVNISKLSSNPLLGA
jgi:hypothetical protein